MPLLDVAALAVVVLAGVAVYGVLRAAARPEGASMTAWVAVVCMVLAVLVVGGQMRSLSHEVALLRRDVEALRRASPDPAAIGRATSLGSDAAPTKAAASGADALENDDLGSTGTTSDIDGGRETFEPVLAEAPDDAVDGRGEPAPSTWARLEDAFRGLDGPGHAARRGSVELGGGAGGALPIRVFGQDLLEVRIFNHAGHDAAALEGLALRVGARKIALLEDGGRYGEQRVRVAGDVADEVTTSLDNPGELSGVTVRLLARSIQPVRARRAFEQLLSDAAYRRAADKRFRSIATDDLRLRAAPNLDSEIQRKLEEGAYVLIIRSTDGWSEVETPEGERGFVKSEFLGRLDAEAPANR